MEACLTQMDRQRPTADATQTDRRSAISWISKAVLACIGLGFLWRLLRYCQGFPIWGDEAMLLLNILNRDYAGLTQHLRFAQVAPLFFLWLEKSAILIFGTSEWSVHLFPMLAGILALAVFWNTCRTNFRPLVAGLAVSIFAVSYYPVRHACEVKPYSFDVCFAVLFLWSALNQLRNPACNRWLIVLIAVTPLAVFSSYPSVFVAGSVSLVLLPAVRNGSWTQCGLWAAFNVVLLASFAIHFGMIGHHQIDASEAARTREFLRQYWKDAFPPEELSRWPLWLGNVFTGNMLAYPIGANHGGSSLTLLLVLIGSVSIWRRGQRSLLALCWLPFALNLIAAVMEKYPFGDSARITLHLAPFICILMAHGIAQVLDWIRSPRWQSRLLVVIYVLLLGCGIFGIARDIARPFKTEHDRDVRKVARELVEQIEIGETAVLNHDRDEDLLSEFLWNLRAAHLDLRWRNAPNDAGSYWLVECSHQEPALPSASNGWHVTQSNVRPIPPENAKMHTVYCRWTRIVRD